MKNINIEHKDDLLIIKVDTSKNFGASRTGKSTIIASTEGNIPLTFGKELMFLGMNVYKK